MVQPLMNAAGLKRGKSYLKARKMYSEIAEWEIVGYTRGTRIVAVLMMACSKKGLEEGAHHKYLGRAKVPVEVLANLVAENCSIAAAAVVALAAAAVGVDVAADVVVVVAAAALAVVAELAAAVEPAAVVAAEAQESGDFVADHHFHQTWLWEMGEG